MFNDKQPSYQRLRSIIAERTNRLVVWIGSGLSAPAGLPSWSQLKEKLCGALIEKASAMDPDELNHARKRAAVIRGTKDYWLAFHMLQRDLGQTTYRTTIRESLQTSETCPIPENYLTILSLPVTGIISLNLDRIATRAYTQKNPGKSLIEFVGFQASNFLHVLKGATPFIVNLHGMSSDESSWVLTKDQLGALQKNEGYNEFVRSCLITRTVMFVGISADDVAIGGHLDKLADAKIDLGDHFWITNHTDKSTESWAESTQLQLIRYGNQSGNHSELREILTALGDFKPEEEGADPVTMACTHPNIDLPSPVELQSETDPEKIREILNSQAVEILKPSSESGEIDYERYNHFCHEYDEAIYRSWYVTCSPPRNKLFGYTIESEVTEGAFGRVFRAFDAKGRFVAIKVLREEVRRKPEMLQSFRRGVRSMRILAGRQVKGMIPYEEASEIPAVAVMEFVEVPNLQEAVQSRYIEDWKSILEIAVQLANIIRRAHLLPERVLHRDIRPPNIMLQNFYRSRNFKVVVLDFDLSWHLGAQEASITNQSSLSGFLSPEQVDSNSGMSTRSAAVDSFGIGMTLYYIRTGKEPHYLHHLHKTWEEDLYNTILSFPCLDWQSIPVRFSRLVLNSTKHEQTKRWDMGQIEGELELLRESILRPMEVSSSELIAEELAQRVVNAGEYPRYRWDPDNLCAFVNLQSGVELCIKADESARNIRVQVEWLSWGDKPHKNVHKYLKPITDGMISLLRSRGWKILPVTKFRSSETRFAVIKEAEAVLKDMQCQAEEIAASLRKFDF